MIGAAEQARFWELLQQRLGWTLTDTEGGQTTAVLQARAKANGLSPRAYLDRLAGSGWATETAELAEQLSITETYFFRHIDQFRVLRERALPERVRARSGQRTLRLLSVGCSSGEETYSLAILAVQARPALDWIISVIGVDANRRMLDKAREAAYHEWSLRETPADIRRRWFRQTDDEYRVDPEVTGTVQFVEHNLSGDIPQLWQPRWYDVIFCRNLLMYLTEEVQAELVARITDSLAPGGYLFLGHTDSLGSRPEGLEMVHEDGVVFYRRPEPRPAPTPPRHTPAPRPVDEAPHQEDFYARGLALVREERFADALVLVQSPERDNIRELLLRGVLLVQLGRLDEARDSAHRLMDIGGPHPDAHHLLGVCHELDCADQAGAQYRLAAYLDPAFAMPRLRMGLLARRRNDARGAAANLEAALELLVREDDERIVLFGGGFGRLALTRLCRTELEACGVRR